MEYIPVEKKTVGFLPKRGNLSKAFSLEVRYHSTTNIQRYIGGEICIIKIQIYNGDSYSKKYSFEVFSQKMPPIFHFSWKPGDRRPIVHTSVEAACLCWPGVVHCCLFILLFAFYFVCFVSFVYFVCTLFTFSLARCCSLLLYCTSFCSRLCCFVSFVYFACTLFTFSLTRCCSLLLVCASFATWRPQKRCFLNWLTWHWSWSRAWIPSIELS